MPLIEELSADDQAAFDAMRSESAQPDASGEGTAAPEPPAQPASGTTETPAVDPAVTPEPQPKTVPLSALHEERERRKDLDAQLKAERERFNLVVQRLGQPQQPAQPEAPRAPEIPDLATDPAGHILATLRATGMTVEQLAQSMQQNTQRQREQEAIAELQTYAAAAEQQHRAETPDYDAAVTFLIAARNRLLEADGMIDPAARLAQINREKLQLAHNARQRGKNPAAVAYEMAQIYGYAPQAPAPAVADPAPDPNAGTERLERVAAGQQQGRSLSNTRGSAPPATPPAQRIAEMAPDKFAALLADAEKNPEKMREIFGA